MNDLLDRLEQSTISKSTAEIIDLSIKKSINDDGFSLSSFFSNKLRNKIDLKSLLNIINNCAEHRCLNYVGTILNDIIIWFYSNKNTPKYLYYILVNDVRTNDSLINQLGHYLALSYNSISCSIEMINDIHHKTNISLCDLYYEVLNSLPITSDIRHIIYLRSMTKEDVCELFIKSIRKDSKKDSIYSLFYKTVSHINEYSYTNDYYKYLQSKLDDNCGICLAIRETNIHTVHLNSFYRFQKCLFDVHERIPKTIEYLFKKIIEQDNMRLLCELGNVYNKTKIFKYLVISSKRNNNDFYLKYFIRSHLDCEEVRKLAVFI
jgi:hypothetical protein